MAPKFNIGGQGDSGRFKAPGEEKKGNRFDLSGSRVKDRASVEGKFQFGDVPGSREAENAAAQKEENGEVYHVFEKKSRFGKTKPSDQGPMYGYQKHRFRKGDELSPYNELQDARTSDPRDKKLLVMAVVLVVVFVLGILLPNRILSDGVTKTFADLVTLTTIRIGDLIKYVTGSGAGINTQPDIWRYIIIALSGAVLGMTGAVYQGALKNALASPTTLGVTAGGTLGSMIYIVLTYSAVVGTGSLMIDANGSLSVTESMGMLDYFLFRNGQALCSLAGCLASVAIVLTVAHIAGRGKLSSVALIVCGQVLMMTINAGSNLVRFFYTQMDPNGPISQALRTARSYSFNSYYLPIDALAVAVPVLICMFVVMRLRFKLTLLAFNDEEARSMGISVTSTRNLMVGVCTLMTAVVIAFGGNAGYVGFLIPHVTRRIIGPDFKYLIPASALMGSIFLIGTFYITSLFENLAGGVGLFTSVIGGVMFIVIALRSRNQSAADGY